MAKENLNMQKYWNKSTKILDHKKNFQSLLQSLAGCTLSIASAFEQFSGQQVASNVPPCNKNERCFS